MMDIDLVYLWVDGSDPVWRAKRDAYIGKPSDKEVNCEGRFADNGELMYSLRSVEKYAPWIRKIYIVSNGQTPSWLDTTNAKIKIIHQADIMPKKCSPCFNSMIIEHHLHNIPGLSEQFLYANDDMFINKPVTPDMFFTDDGSSIVRLIRRPLRKWIVEIRDNFLGWHLTNYGLCLNNAALLVEKHYGTYYGDKPHHNIDAYQKSVFQLTREIFAEEINATLSNRMRSPNDIQRHIYSCVALAEGRGHIEYVSKHTSLKFHMKKGTRKRFYKYNPTFFCVSDSQFVTDEGRKLVPIFLNELFPEKSQFEK